MLVYDAQLLPAWGGRHFSEGFSRVFDLSAAAPPPDFPSLLSFPGRKETPSTFQQPCCCDDTLSLCVCVCV